jgi:uroporphyrinogen-III synthase
MNKATFLAVQLNVDDVAASPGLVELLNTHLVFAADVAEAADALVQLASIAGLSSVEIPALAIERLREALDNLSGYDESWLLALEPSRALFDEIGRRHRTLH